VIASSKLPEIGGMQLDPISEILACTSVNDTKIAGDCSVCVCVLLLMAIDVTSYPMLVSVQSGLPCR